MPDRAPIEVEVVMQCRECGGLGQQWYTDTTTDYPETCRRCKGLGKDTERRTLAPGSLDEALHRLGLAHERLRLADERGYAQSRAGGVTAGTVAAYESAQEECQDLLAEVRRLREAKNV